MEIFKHDGVQYLKSISSGVIYNMEQDAIGKWNACKKCIEFYEDSNDSGDECVEEVYEE